MTVATVTLNNGVKMPQEGFGVYQVTDLEECKRSVMDALAAGYRSLDTAQIYRNEEAVGAAIAESPVERKDIFLTTKVWISNYGEEATKRSLDLSMQKLQTDYLDLVLLHQPYGDVYGAYRALEAYYKAGKIRAIGVSNFYDDRFIDLASNVDVVPAINQVETHVFNQQVAAQKIMNDYGTQIESWGPFAEGRNDLFTNPVLTEIGTTYHKSAAQVALRYLIQRQVVIIPKSTHADRMAQNLDIWDFTLTDKDMAAIQALDTQHSVFMDHRDPETVKGFMQMMHETF